MIPDGMQYYLDRKYSILQQQADATTQNAGTAALTGKAQAGLDNTRAAWLPKESAASIAKTVAETGLIGQQAKVVVPESQARIANMNANTDYTGTETKVLRRTSLTPLSELFGSESPSIEALRRGRFQFGSTLGN